jgi:hypothetical protein
VVNYRDLACSLESVTILARVQPQNLNPVTPSRRTSTLADQLDIGIVRYSHAGHKRGSCGCGRRTASASGMKEGDGEGLDWGRDVVGIGRVPRDDVRIRLDQGTHSAEEVGPEN